MIELTSAPIGEGRERSCYLHPDDPNKLIKISAGPVKKQSRREIECYQRLQRSAPVAYTHVPEFYGLIETNLGTGIMVDTIRDYDGQISRSFREYLDEGVPIETFEDMLEELRQFLYDNLIIFNHDIVSSNILYQRLSPESGRLVLIDALGDVVFFKWPNRFPSHVRAKITRRWDDFIQRLHRRLNSEKNQ